MIRLAGVLLVLAGLGFGSHHAIAQPVLSVCDYTPPESHIRDLGLRGSFQWYDGPYADDRARTISITAGADYALLISSPTSGHRVDAVADILGSTDEWTFSLRGDGDVKSFWRDDVFGLGAFGLDASPDTLEVDATVGLGTGRFRDVTPMAKAIRIQNALLDLGVLLAPLENEPLLAAAQVLGEVGPLDDEKTVTLSELLVSTGLVRGDDLGVAALFAIEEIIGSAEGGRLCGGDLQGRIGVSALLLPEASIATTGMVLYNAALVPDPVSQVTSNASCKFRLARLDEWNLEASVTYTRRLPEGWTARASYRLSYDHGWTAAGEANVSHAASASLTTQIFGAVGLSLAGELRYETDDEELTTSLTAHLAYDLF